MSATITGAKNIRPGPPGCIVLKDCSGAGRQLPLYDMLYDPYDKKEAPTRDQTSKAQG
jgi:hypothetical protein